MPLLILPSKIEENILPRIGSIVISRQISALLASLSGFGIKMVLFSLKMIQVSLTLREVRCKTQDDK